MPFEFAEFTIDLEARLLRRGPAQVHLSPKAFDLLSTLIAARPRAVPRQELYDRLWPDTFVVDTNLPVLIREIRQALDDREHALIRTVHRHGYAFAAEVREHAQARAAFTPHVLIHGATELPLFPGRNVVGREAGTEVRIVSPHLSRRHAVITVDDGNVLIDDLGSKNGTFVQGQRVDGPTALKDGATIAFGTIEVTYRRLGDDTTLTAG